MHFCLKYRKHSNKISDSFSNFHDLLIDVPEGSILVPPLFNIYICDLFLQVKKVTSYVDDTTPYSNNDNDVNFIEDIEVKVKT